MSFAVGSLVKTRGREWVVLPESKDDLLMLRPLGGTEDEICGVYLPLEIVEPASFDLPDPTQLGDYQSCQLLRNALRLGFRSSAGPFRSFAQIAVDPRPYQLVPLLMALKLNPVRLLIADDVGIGKTIEACLVARELLDRGEVLRMAVLCPPQLAEQWQKELSTKFHIDAELVLPSTVNRLERNRAIGQSIFDIYPYVIVSTDFIKSDRHRDEFLRSAPELVIVDEAHTCAYGATGRGGRHQRYQLISGLSQNPNRHLILVTATPHSGNEEAFRSLLGFLNPDFQNLPEDLTGKENEPQRRNLAKHFIQRRRADIRYYMKADTPFPERQEADEMYELSPEYHSFFDKVLAYARETVIDTDTNQHRQRVRWWSALALLRSLASSPAAAAATLRNRVITADTETIEEADEIGRQTILDMDEDEIAERIDIAPGADLGDHARDVERNRKQLLSLAREADALMNEKDEKIQKAIKLVKNLLKEGFRPILFCRFIATAEYVASVLREKLPGNIDVIPITGTLPPAEREERIAQLEDSKQHVLVCSDCLSEGINLQTHFDAVIHYDLCWNPTRHEQRAGRVDRYGQIKPHVRVVTYFGKDNQIDGIILDVLLRKHQRIKNSLGISVPVPIDSNQVIEAIFEGLLLREKEGSAAAYLPGFEEYFKPKKDDLFTRWDDATAREKRSRTMFAQESIKVEEVTKELNDVQNAIGSSVDVAHFVKEGLKAHQAVISGNKPFHFNIHEVPKALREALGDIDQFDACFELPCDENVLYLHRTHPIVEGLANYIINTALDPLTNGIARRCGVIRSSKIHQRTTLLLLRLRYHIITTREDQKSPLLAEDCQLLGFMGSPQHAEWIDAQNLITLLNTVPEANINPDQATDFVRKVVDNYEILRPYLDRYAVQHGQEILDAHRRVRTAAQIKGINYDVESKLPADILGIYIYLPLVSGV
jgi:superfamily II DNA or RNA helicase